MLQWKQKVNTVIQSRSILGTVFKKTTVGYAAGKQVNLLTQIEQQRIEILCVPNKELGKQNMRGLIV